MPKLTFVGQIDQPANLRLERASNAAAESPISASVGTVTSDTTTQAAAPTPAELAEHSK